MKRTLFLGLALLLALAPGIYAQVATGNIYGTVTDESGAVLPGANVALSGDLGTRSTTSSNQGDFRFLNLDRGRYKVTVSLAGFSTVNREVNVVTGENVTLDFGLKVAQVAETVTVTAEAALVDLKKRGTSTTMTTEELQNMPNARDPWGVLKSVPGVLLDRINIAGNENGQQASVSGKGSVSADKIWNLDGINITDMSATGASPTYFDFEAFQEINVSTGGNDLQVQTGGIGINLVTKRGTNKFHGGGRYLLADEDWSSSNLPDALKGDARLKGSEFADHIKRIKDWGFELGGPIVKDKLWFYGTYGKQDIKLIRLNQTPDDTILPGYNAKINWQATGQTMVSAFWFLGNKQKFGRQPSAPVQGEDSFNWNQANAYTDGGLPAGLWKLQIDHTFSPNFFISAKGAYYDTGFGLIARGGPDKTYTLDYVTGLGYGSYSDYLAIRPLKLGAVDGNYFFGSMGGNNELKFGFSYRDLTTNSQSNYNGNQLVGVINSTTDPTENVARVYRNSIVNYGGKYVAAYIGDTFTKNRLTVNFGVRWDLQTAKNLASEGPANVTFPQRLPALKYDGASENAIRWNDISPRAGFSYALDEGRKTVLRASFARYAGQLSYGNVTDENPLNLGFLAYGWRDLNNDKFVQPNEVRFDEFLYNISIDPDNPSAVGTTVNKLDRDWKAKHDNEFILGLDHELAPNLAIGGAYTFRRGTDWAWRPRIAGPCTGEPSRATCPIITPGQYTANAPVTLTGLTARTFSPNPTLVTAGGGGRLRTNRDGYYTNFSGLELTLVKRLSNKWMARGAFSWNDWTEHWKDGVTPTGFLGNPGPWEDDPLVQGGQVANLSGGSGKASFYTSVKWQFSGNMMVQLPWQIDLSTSVFGKQGGPYPQNVRLSAGRDSTRNALASPTVDSKRYDNVWDADFRLAKHFRFVQQGGITISAEVFNAFNNGVVLSRFRSAGPTLERIEEIIAPRTIRLGARLSF
jgi:hypothetical protein